MTELLLKNESDTARLACIVSSLLAPVDCLTLTGDLGAGKTTFMRYLIAALSDTAPEVISPSFLIMQEYSVFVGALPPTLALPPPLRASHLLGLEKRCGLRTPATLYHLDGYRLNGPEEIPELGLDEIFTHNIVAIEWPDRFAGFLPRDRLDMEMIVEDGLSGVCLEGRLSEQGEARSGGGSVSDGGKAPSEKRKIKITGEGKHAHTATEIHARFHDHT